MDRGVSITYTNTVGNVIASDSVMILPDADHVNASIWPGVSIIQKLMNYVISSYNQSIAQHTRDLGFVLRPNRPLDQIVWQRD